MKSLGPHLFPRSLLPSRCILPVFLSLVLGSVAGAATGVDRVAQGSGKWDKIDWAPEGTPERGDIIHIEGGFVLDYTEGESPHLSRLYLGDSTGEFPNDEGTLKVSGGVLIVHANAAGAIVVGHSKRSTGTLSINGGSLRGIGNRTGAGIRVGQGDGSSGTVTVESGELALGNGVVLGLGDKSEGHFTVSGGSVSVGNQEEGGPFNVGGRQVEGGSSTATYRQTGGTVTIVSQYFGVGHAGRPDQEMNSTAEISGGKFSANVRVGRHEKLRSGGGVGGVLTIGPKAEVSGRDEAWVLGGNGALVFVLGTDASFNPVDLTSAETNEALVVSQKGAKISVDGSELTYAKDLGPITLIQYPADREINELSEDNVEFVYTGFDPRFEPKLVWNENGLQLQLER